MNDVTVLVPLPTAASTPVLFKATDLAADGTALVPDALYQRVIQRATGTPDVFATLADFQVVAVRFDLCDRQLPWPCPDSEDARLRLVFQVLGSMGEARDIALHGFYEIPQAELPELVNTLRDLAALQDEPITSPLKVSPALSAHPTGAWASQLKTLVRRYANTAGLRRLTFFAQPDVFAQVRWVFRGLEGRPPTYGFITIAGAGGTEQDVFLASTATDVGYSAMPFSDQPTGLARAVDGAAFASATGVEQKAALGTLLEVGNPVEHTPTDVQCVACHVATFLTAQRAQTAGLTVDGMAAQYVSTWDLSIAAGKSATNERFLRALGWLNRDPLISQRVANETAQTLTELDVRFPVQ